MLKYILNISFILITIVSFSQNSFELRGKIKIEGSNLKAVRIVVTKNGQAFKTLRPDSQGKYSFNLDYNNTYVVAFQKNGFVTKRVEVNTNVTDAVLQNDSYKYRWKVDVGLFKEYEGIDFSFFEKPIQKIYFVERNDRFDYDNKYAQKIEKELKRLIAEVEQKKAEEARQAEIERQKEIDLQKKIAREKLAEQRKQRAEQERIASQSKQQQESIPPTKKTKPTYTQPKRTPPTFTKTVENKEFSTETYSDKYKDVTYITVAIGAKINIYRKVKWNWGPTYYFRNSENISYHIFYQDTKSD